MKKIKLLPLLTVASSIAAISPIAACANNSPTVETVVASTSDFEYKPESKADAATIKLSEHSKIMDMQKAYFANPKRIAQDFCYFVAQNSKDEKEKEAKKEYEHFTSSFEVKFKTIEIGEQKVMSYIDDDGNYHCQKGYVFSGETEVVKKVSYFVDLDEKYKVTDEDTEEEKQEKIRLRKITKQIYATKEIKSTHSIKKGFAYLTYANIDLGEGKNKMIPSFAFGVTDSISENWSEQIVETELLTEETTYVDGKVLAKLTPTTITSYKSKELGDIAIDATIDAFQDKGSYYFSDVELKNE